MAQIKFGRGLAAAVSAASVQNPDTVYFATDTHDIYVGGKQYGYGEEAKQSVAALVAEMATKQGKLTAGTGIAIAENGEISCTLDNTLFKVVASLPAAPAAGDENKLHLVKVGDVAGDKFAEYVYADGAWEKLGEVAAEVDLSGYVLKTDFENHKHSWADIESGKPTTLGGYGITDGATASSVEALEKTVSDNKAAIEERLEAVEGNQDWEVVE